MFSYNRPNRKTTFWIDSGDRNVSGDYMRTSLKGWFSYNRRYRFDRPGLQPIARIEHGRSKRSRSPQSPQAWTIVYVMFSYNRPNRKTTFWTDSGDRNDSGDYMRTSLKQPLTTATATATKTSLENKRLGNGDYFVIISSSSPRIHCCWQSTLTIDW